MTRDFGSQFFWVGYCFRPYLPGWGGPRVVAIGRMVKSEKLGSPIQLCV